MLVCSRTFLLLTSPKTSFAPHKTRIMVGCRPGDFFYSPFGISLMEVQATFARRAREEGINDLNAAKIIQSTGIRWFMHRQDQRLI
jgi:hypothetical protein